MIYELWSARVNRILHRQFGMGIADGFNWPQWSTWAAGVTPDQGALIWVRYQQA